MDISKKINLIAEQFFAGNNVAFANRMGTSEANIRNYRKSVVPKIDFLVTMCNELEISFDWLFNSQGPMFREKVELNMVAESESDAPYKNPKYQVNQEETIRALHQVISAQEKTIQAMEELLSIKSTDKKGRVNDPVGST